ncbi:uncharacterized protein EAE98_009334 [Botrytis deweyae]|uniref:DNA mismatch repair protein S5 domain-containing protein n=1 Tax=Botrytis deweyae TaxID=2478750 RepID=A0ABQ7IC07_9HELO|nr:uncharacterized protein EAE98_009334 [Botrytis deweyae]KAF7915789.1 hypothetical protein EAE99_010040 [Botrytis elliptica]KAF7919494.1 hypothetical protein EAE98_009334 [Botrytis deweyae]
MAIKPLSDSTIHLLGSSQVLTTPTSLIKELIDNALDAKATSIDILISHNTIDKIEVRDNGHGIQPDDLDALGRRGHTSKLTTFTELRNIGGRSLGFRGEALASACQLGDVSITTKMDGQLIATCVKLKALGGIQSQSRSSHPTGTTVCVMNFMSKLPVRKQTALKEAPRIIGKIQELIRRYALARLSVKLTLKIVKGTKGAWSYSPRPNIAIKDSVSLVIGREAALQCFEASMIFPGSPDRENDASEAADIPADVNPANDVETSHFRLEAFIPRPDAEQSKIGCGQYFSVDSRPVASDKGTMKKITIIFKKYLRSRLASGAPSEKLKNPFMRLNIACPKASYDPNVEPAKDDIIFENETLVLEAAEKMFNNFYGDCDTVMSKVARNNTVAQPTGFEILLARTPQQDSPPPSSVVNASLKLNNTHPASTTIPNSKTMSEVCPSTAGDTSDIAEPDHYEFFDEATTLGGKRKWGCNMSHDYTEYTDDFNPRTSVNKSQKELYLNSNQLSVSKELNPWVIAKMTAPINTNSSTTSTNSSSAISLDSIENISVPSVSPRAVTDVISPVQASHFGEVSTSIVDVLHSHSNFKSHMHGNPMTPADQSDSTTEGDVPVVQPSHDRLDSNGFITATNFVRNPLMSPPSTSPNAQLQKQTRDRGSNKPFVPPSRTPQSNSVSSGHVQAQSGAPYQPFRIQREACDQPAATASPVLEVQKQQPNPNPELEWAMDFEHRKESATRRRRDELQAMRETFQQPPATSKASSRPSPHKNRYNAALASLEMSQESLGENSSSANNESVCTTLPDSDPRGYLMKRQKSFSVLSSISGGPRKLKRAQTLRLPLESIPADLQIHQLLQTVQSDINGISKLVMETSEQDTYVRRGTQARGLEMTTTDRDAVGKKLCQVVEAWMKSGRGEKCDVEFLFGGLESLSGA